MKRVERTDDRSVWLHKLPDEPLGRIDAHEEIESQRGRQGMPPAAQHEKCHHEGDHDGRLVELHGMSAHPVSKVDSPRQCSPRTERVVVESGQKAPDPTDRDRDRQGDGESYAGRASNPGARLEQLDADDPTGEPALDTARDGVHAAHPQID